MGWDDFKSYEKEDDPIYGWEDTDRPTESGSSIKKEKPDYEDESVKDVTIYGLRPEELEAFNAKNHGKSGTSHTRRLHSSVTGRKLGIADIVIILLMIGIFGYAIMAFAGKLVATMFVIIICIYLYAIT